ncbi:multicopper oxidase family protein [Streptomyces qinglanensis]|uniref:multicopper oxidase family protein n=1 Tax=Streptomyces qinglanensis TaxID=943816 RepID=UPI00378CCAD4
MRSLPARRTVLGAAALTATGLTAGCADRGRPDTAEAEGGGHVRPDGPEVRAADARRPHGRTRRVRLTATRTRLALGSGVTVPTWAYGDRVPGEEIRATAGGALELTLANHLPAATSVHWHGLALRNDMDGVPGLTQREIRPGADFTYRFAVPHPGTYWFHPHSGLQRDRGLYAPLIVEDPREPLRYDKEWVVVLDDWLDGVDGATPDSVLAALRRGMDHGGDGAGGDGAGGDGSGDAHGMHGMLGTGARPSAAAGPPSGTGPSPAAGTGSPLLGGDAGDVDYPHHLVNGRTRTDPETFRAKPGDRVRIRLINAGGDTAYRVALGGHRMTVTHTDGYPVEHTATDALLLGMGERYDVLVTAGDGVFALTALAEGKKGTARALLRTAPGAAPPAAARPEELSGTPLTAGRLAAADAVRLAPRTPDRTVTLRLTGSMARYDWGIGGRQYDPRRRHPVTAGERVRLRFVNTTGMWHPMHLHGHTFALPDGGPRKDTAIVLPGRTLEVDFDADNPGLWLVHCHNVYHSGAGMMTVLGYRA